MTGLSDVRDVVRGAIASFFGFGGRLIARAALMIIAGRAFGIEALGVLGQVAAIIEIAAAIGVMGLKRGLLDILSFDAENGRAPETRILEALGVALFISALISGLLLFLWPFVLGDQAHLAPLLLVAVPAIVFTDVSLTAIKYKRIIGWDVWARGIAEPWGFLLLAVGFLAMGATAFGLIAAYVGSVVIAGICAGIGLLRTYSLRALAQSKPKISNWLAVVRPSVPVGITDIGVMMLRRIDLIVLSFFVGPQAVGLYYMVQQLATIPQKVYPLFEPMLSPVIARLHNRMDNGKIRSNLIGVCRWVLIIQLAISIPMVVFGDYLLAVFGSEFATGALVLAIILLAELIDGAFLAVETPLVFAKPRIPPLLLFAALIIEIVMIALLSSQWGVEGAAAGFLIAIGALSAGRLIMLKKHLHISVINASYILPIAFALFISVGLWGARHWIDPHQGVIIVFCFVAGIVGYLFLVRSFALTQSDRILFRALAQRRRRSAPS